MDSQAGAFSTGTSAPQTQNPQNIAANNLQQGQTAGSNFAPGQLDSKSFLESSKLNILVNGQPVPRTTAATTTQVKVNTPKTPIKVTPVLVLSVGVFLLGFAVFAGMMFKDMKSK